MKKYWIALALMVVATSTYADWYQGKEKGVFDPFYYIGETVSSALDATYGRVIDTLGRPPARYVDTIPVVSPAIPAVPQTVTPAAQQIPQQYQPGATPAPAGGYTQVYVDQGGSYGLPYYYGGRYIGPATYGYGCPGAPCGLRYIRPYGPPPPRRCYPSYGGARVYSPGFYR